MKKFIGHLAVIGLVVVGCSQKESSEIMKEDSNAEINTNVISDLILYQYGRELNTWKALSPKVRE